jgi:hypothetical protein
MADLPWPPPVVDRAPVVVPLPDGTAATVWEALVALDERLASPWCLVGGQMVVLHCLEHDIVPPRATDDGDIVVDVFVERAALRHATAVLADLGFAQRTDSGGYGYRWAKGDAHVDVLVPDRANAQQRPPRTAVGARSVETPAAQQAVARAQRVPVVVGGLTGYVPRPDLLGAVVVKAAAAVADTRDAERHRQDVAVLCGLAATGGLPALLRAVTPKDRRRLHKVAAAMPAGHRIWRHAPDPPAAADAFRLLLEQG